MRTLAPDLAVALNDRFSNAAGARGRVDLMLSLTGVNLSNLAQAFDYMLCRRRGTAMGRARPVAFLFPR